MSKASIVSGSVVALALGAYFIATRDANHGPVAAEQRQTLPAAAGERTAQGMHRERSTEQRAPAPPATPTMTELGLQVLPNGELVIDGATRSVIEELSAVADVSELHEIKDYLQQTLPPAAGKRATDLVERFYRYRIALDARLHHAEMAEVPEDATLALDALKALRTEFFGAELTQLWFAAEDAIGREMIAQAQRLR